MHPPTTNWLEQLSNLSFFWIAIACGGLTLVRLLLMNGRTIAARNLSEMIDSVLLAFVLVFLLLRPFAVQAFFIPSPSMEPTLIGNNNIGDKILVNKFVYRVSPVKTGDVVVFIPPKQIESSVEGTHPGDTVNFIKRLMGQGGDKLESVAGYCMIGGVFFNHNDIRQGLYVSGVYGDDVPPDDVEQHLQGYHHLKFAGEGVYADSQFISKAQVLAKLGYAAGTRIEIHPGYDLRNHKRINEPFTAEDPDYDLKFVDGGSLKRERSAHATVFKFDGSQIEQRDYDRLNNSPAEALPAGQYFMMGDNRNYSLDSTEWGPVGRSRIVGRADLVLWPYNRIGRIVPSR